MQEFEPQSQIHRQEADREEEVYSPQYPYSWSGKLDKEAGPRDEPPSSVGSWRSPQENENAMQNGYRAQDYAANQQSQQNSKQYSSDGDALEKGYHPYNTHNTYNMRSGVPPWARPQRHRGGAGRWILFIVLGLFLLKPILALIGILLAFIGIAALAILLPLIFLLIVGSFILLMLRVTFRSGRRPHYMPRRTRYWNGRGPWR